MLVGLECGLSAGCVCQHGPMRVATLLAAALVVSACSSSAADGPNEGETPPPAPTSTPSPTTIAPSPTPPTPPASEPPPVTSADDGEIEIELPVDLPTEPSVFLTPVRIDEIRADIDAGREPVATAWERAKAAADAAVTYEPTAPETFELISVYVNVDPRPAYDEANRRAIKLDANAAYAAGLGYAITGDEAYAEAVVRIVGAWSTGVIYDTSEEARLNVALHLPAHIIAMDLTRGSAALTPAIEAAFAEFLVADLAELRPTDPNNHTDWGLLLIAGIAAFVGDDARLEQAAEIWRRRLVAQLTVDGVFHREVVRQAGVGDRGINYTHVVMQAMTMTAEVLRVNGHDVYGAAAPTGQSLELGYRTAIPWVADPSTFPFFVGDAAELIGVDKYAYWEILDARWPDPTVDDLLEGRRPIETVVGFEPFLTLTHG